MLVVAVDRGLQSAFFDFIFQSLGGFLVHQGHDWRVLDEFSEQNYGDRVELLLRVVRIQVAVGSIPQPQHLSHQSGSRSTLGNPSLGSSYGCSCLVAPPYCLLFHLWRCFLQSQDACSRKFAGFNNSYAIKETEPMIIL